ncbi:MAG: hypothetical protein GY757_39645 [bacterium]|nr:hypothetical protein [bacterium]
MRNNLGNNIGENIGKKPGQAIQGLEKTENHLLNQKELTSAAVAPERYDMGLATLSKQNDIQGGCSPGKFDCFYGYEPCSSLHTCTTTYSNPSLQNFAGESGSSISAVSSTKYNMDVSPIKKESQLLDECVGENVCNFYTCTSPFTCKKGHGCIRLYRIEGESSNVNKTSENFLTNSNSMFTSNLSEISKSEITGLFRKSRLGMADGILGNLTAGKPPGLAKALGGAEQKVLSLLR